MSETTFSVRRHLLPGPPFGWWVRGTRRSAGLTARRRGFVTPPMRHQASRGSLMRACAFDSRVGAELTPSLASSFRTLGMEAELAKCELLRATSLKQIGRTEEALEGLECALSVMTLEKHPALRARLLSECGD